jgi:signal transduction histidine kinase
MTSLRSRLILGSALIAILPLALAMFLFSRQVGSMVQTQSADRLGAALGGLDVQLHVDDEHVAERLQILGKDPTMKRLYLVREGGGAELAEFVEERRRLLGLDFLNVTDPNGALVVDAAEPDNLSVPAMSASAPILYEGTQAGAIHGGVRLDLPYLRRLKQTTGVELALVDSAGRPIASTLDHVPQSSISAAPGTRWIRLDGHSYLARAIDLSVAGSRGAHVLALVSTATADATIAALRLTALGLGLVGLVLAIAFALVWSSLISRPVENLAAFSRQLASGEWEEPLRLHSVRELETLGEALDSMRRDLQSYRGRLVVSERQAAWGQMARKVAHEIKNPLTPIAVSVADLRRSFEQRREDFPQVLDQAVRIVGEEVERLKHLLQEFSDFGRLPAPRLAPCELRDLMDGLETLHAGEVAEGRLHFSQPIPDIRWSADSGQLRQALVNLIRNGLEAGGKVTIAAAALDCRMLEITVTDDGPGLTADQMANLFVPGFTTKAAGSGLGLTITEKIVSDHGGTILAERVLPHGTTLRVRLPLAPKA